MNKSIDDLKRMQQTVKAKTAKSRVDSIDASLYPCVLCLVVQSRDKTASSYKCHTTRSTTRAWPLISKKVVVGEGGFETIFSNAL